MNWRSIKYITIILLLCIQSCTTEVDLVMDDSYQKLAEVELNYDLSNISDIDKIEMPDSLIIVAYRIVNSWKCSYMAPFSETSNTGRYLYNKPYQNTNENPNINKTEDFLVKNGEYRFIAMNNMFTDSIMYKKDTNKYWFSTESLIDSAITNKDIGLYYANYSLKNEFVNKYGNAWSDFNPYSTYISNSRSPIFFCYTDVYSLNNNVKNHIKLTFDKVTQDIEIRFSIRHESVVIEQIMAEISGIPCGINLLTKKIDYQKTYKTIFDVERIDNTIKNIPINISEDKSLVTEYAGKINVLGLMSSIDKNEKYGPGIMQLAIYTHTFNERGEKKSKIIHLGINLYNTINKYSHIISGCNEKVVLNIEEEINIKKDEVLINPNNDNTIDNWVKYNDIHLDI